MALRARRRRTGFLPPAVLAVGEYLDLTGDVVDAFLRERVDVHQLVALLVHEHDVERDRLPRDVLLRTEADVNVDPPLERPVHAKPAISHRQVDALANQELLAGAGRTVE